MTILVEVEQVSKHFSGARALEDVTISFKGGEIHALVGENGAGKSTLSKIIAGVQTADSGEMRVDGERVHFHSAAAANARGITMVHQELSVIGSLSVGENVLIGIEPTWMRVISRKALDVEAEQYLRAVGLSVDPRTSAGRLPVAQQQLVEIARALALNSSMLILDEPTSSLGQEDAARLLTLINELRDRGTAVVLVSHNLKEVLETADRVSVLRDGRLVASGPASSFEEHDLIRHMVGHEVEMLQRRSDARVDSAELALSVSNLSAPGVRNASLQVRAGEILGIGGLVGSGRSETLAAIYGATQRFSGQMTLFGHPFDPHAPTDSLRLGVGLVPESRKDQGLNLGLSVAHNVELAALDHISWGPWVQRRLGVDLCDMYVSRLRIKTASTSALVSSLSGGNQQKVVLAKILATRPRVLLLDEPTRGIDVGAKDEVHRLIRELASEGLAIVMVSSVIEELLSACDRIVVMRNGYTVGEVDGATADEESVLQLAFKGEAA
jgi:ABC-type sugar transport system ATPase subunit